MSIIGLQFVSFVTEIWPLNFKVNKIRNRERSTTLGYFWTHQLSVTAGVDLTCLIQAFCTFGISKLYPDETSSILS
jgi:hypothetical protein